MSLHFKAVDAAVSAEYLSYYLSRFKDFYFKEV